MNAILDTILLEISEQYFNFYSSWMGILYCTVLHLFGI